MFLFQTQVSESLRNRESNDSRVSRSCSVLVSIWGSQAINSCASKRLEYIFSCLIQESSWNECNVVLPGKCNLDGLAPDLRPVSHDNISQFLGISRLIPVIIRFRGHIPIFDRKILGWSGPGTENRSGFGLGIRMDPTGILAVRVASFAILGVASARSELCIQIFWKTENERRIFWEVCSCRQWISWLLLRNSLAFERSKIKIMVIRLIPSEISGISR
jgi:hypothetical protein